jgi:predicted nucleic acid-binding protein
MEDFQDPFVFRCPQNVLLPRIWDFHRNAIAYDAAYIVLSEALPPPLVTLEARLAVPGRGEVPVAVSPCDPTPLGWVSPSRGV